ncbi:MAG: electron transfer flavoprotein subunit beta/FixA family protein [Proteobacteria bacterium]|nr:electron transfer flavoprotein subunit beta/FixA family protein [Pseudomonadota bacterium]MBU4419801.1 electron transfer flavoprotein subunit beta/FixA family protein [Pseudomonadota bacterium]MCG2758742.1 electron transfer flavoprotein subunit beta/FixA family protein [Desulfobacteraceae bacterium]
MEIIVLLKQVPATESFIGIADDGVSIKTEYIKWVINPYDEFAVEEALRIKEAQGGSVTVVSAGQERAVEAIRTALAMGADKGILIKDPVVDNCDALGIARILAAAVKDLQFDLIIAGQRAVDDDNFQVGTAVAEFLGIPNISLVIKEEIADGKIKCQRTVEGGTVVLEAPLPALFTTQRGLNEPRYASLPGIMKAKKKPLDIKSLSDIGVDASEIGEPKSKILAMKLPPEREGGRIIKGDSSQSIVAELVNALHKEAKVI